MRNFIKKKTNLYKTLWGIPILLTKCILHSSGPEINPAGPAGLKTHMGLQIETTR